MYYEITLIGNAGSWFLSPSLTSFNISMWYYTFDLVSVPAPFQFQCSVTKPQVFLHTPGSSNGNGEVNFSSHKRSLKGNIFTGVCLYMAGSLPIGRSASEGGGSAYRGFLLEGRLQGKTGVCIHGRLIRPHTSD